MTRALPRRLQVETLEERTLLAGDIGFAWAEGEGAEPLVALRLTAADPTTFQPIEAVHQGEEFVLLLSVEDLRPDGTGVFAAYADVGFPADYLSASDEPGSLIYGGMFANDKSGEVSAGLVDELGAFAGTIPTGLGEQLLAGVRMVATQVGEVQVSSSAADQTPTHDLLLFDRDDPVPIERVAFGNLTISILAPLPEKSIDARPDVQVVNENSAENLFAVLQNDKNASSSPLVITAVDTSDSHGHISIANGGALLVYTPARGFVGTDQFAYTIAADGEQDTATVTVHVERADSQADLVAYNLGITDTAGRPVSAVTVGDEFVLHVTTEDLRDAASGVFGAYLDVRYTAGVAELAGVINYGSSYANGQRGMSIPGELDEVGAFSGSTPLGSGRFELLQVPFLATSPGRVLFEADSAEDLPQSQTLLYDADDAVAVEDILYGRVALTVLPVVVAVDDSYALEASSTPQMLDVLDNDVNAGSGPLQVLSVDATGLLGTVSVSPDGRGVIYTPPAGFDGSEQFRYTASSPSASSTGEVTVHLRPGAALDDQLEVRLATTDLQGHAISSINAGQEFLLQAFVQDLRGDGVDRGVYAAYFDLLYDPVGVHLVPSQAESVGPLIEFAPDFQNGIRSDAPVPGLLNDVGAFQTGTTPLGSEESLLFAAHFRAATSYGAADSFQILEDSQTVLSVLENDLPTVNTATFQADPADNAPLTDALMYEPVAAVPYDRIRYGSATIEVTLGGGASIASVSAGSAGGSIAISDDGTSVVYMPAPNFNGVETFTYSLDGQSEVKVSVAVVAVNDAPVPTSDLYRVRENRVLTVDSQFGVTANDFDPDDDTVQVLLVDGTSQGTLQLSADGSFVYVPNENYSGHDRFTYKLTDGTVESPVVIVDIDVVPRPVSIRLAAVGTDGSPSAEVVADEPILIRALVQDLRSTSDAELGVGAAYLDIAYDASELAPTPSTAGPFSFSVEFGAAYQNGVGGTLQTGRLNDIGAFQTDLLHALGGDELELFRVTFDPTGPRTADDSFRIAAGSSANYLHVLRNEVDLRWDVLLDAQHAANSPQADVAYLNPAEPVPEDDILYGDLTLAIRNGLLTVQSVSSAASGAGVTIEPDGMINYQPVEDFTGPDSFTYTVVDSRGRTATATVTLEVTESWQNPLLATDVNGDGDDSPLDALVIINKLNTVGPHQLTAGVIDSFLDVNGDGAVSPIDALMVINRLLQQAFAEGESVAAIADATITGELPIPPHSARIEVVSAASPLSPAVPQLPELVHRGSEVVDSLGTSTTQDPSRDRSLVLEPDDKQWLEVLATLANDVAPVWAEFSN